jgi:hypothetical protein
MNITGITTYREGWFVYIELEVDNGERIVALPRQHLGTNFYEHTTEHGLLILPDRDEYRRTLPGASDGQHDHVSRASVEPPPVLGAAQPTTLEKGTGPAARSLPKEVR